MSFDLIRIRQYDYDTTYVDIIIIISNILGYCKISVVCVWGGREGRQGDSHGQFFFLGGGGKRGKEYH